MTFGDGSAARETVLFRLPISIRDELKERLLDKHVTLNDHLVSLIGRDLRHPVGQKKFVVQQSLLFVAKGENGLGRPGKGLRAPILVRIGSGERQRIKNRALSLNLTINDYLRSLVSQDISAAREHTEEQMGQTA